MRRWLWPLGIAIVALLGTVLFFMLTSAEPSSRMVVHFPENQGEVSLHALTRKRSATGTTPKEPTAIWLVHDGDRWLAFSNQTAHPRACEVTWDAAQKRFVEPCLGQVFDRTGVNVAGPAIRGLDQYPVAETGWQTIEIDLANPRPAQR